MGKRPAFIGNCESLVKKLLHDQCLILEEMPKDSHRYSIVKPYGVNGTIEHDADGRPRSFIPLDIKRDFALSFELEYYDGVVDVSLGVYTRLEKRQLIRGEWNMNRNGSTHAQPHWHTRLQDDPQPQNAGWIPPSFEDSKAKKYPIRKLHLAMAAHWQDNPLVHDHVLADVPEKGVLNWIEGILTYLQYQFSFKD